MELGGGRMKVAIISKLLKPLTKMLGVGLVTPISFKGRLATTSQVLGVI
jgi:hypothetical protein